MLSDIFHKGEKGFKLVARRPEARPFLTSRGGGERGQGRTHTQKEQKETGERRSEREHVPPFP